VMGDGKRCYGAIASAGQRSGAVIALRQIKTPANQSDRLGYFSLGVEDAYCVGY